MSFNVNVQSLMDTASQIFNAIWPLAAIGIGFSLGIGLVKFVGRNVSGIF